VPPLPQTDRILLPGVLYQRGTQTSNVYSTNGNPYFPSLLYTDTYLKSSFFPLGQNKFIWTGSWTTDTFNSGALFGPLQYDFVSKQWSPAPHAGESFQGMSAGCVTYGDAGAFCVAGGGTPVANTSMFVESSFVSTVLIPQLSVNRAQVAVASNRGTIYFVGGYTPLNAETTRADVFTFNFGFPISTVPQFTIVTGDLPAGRHGGVAVPYSTDRVAYVGGYRAFSPLTVDYVKNDGTTGTLGTLQAGFPEGPASACQLADFMFAVAPTSIQHLQFFSAGISWIVSLPVATVQSTPITAMVSYLVDEQNTNNIYANDYQVKVVFLFGYSVYVWVVPANLYSLTYQNGIVALLDTDLQFMGSMSYYSSPPTVFLVGRRAVVISSSGSIDPLQMLSFDTTNYSIYMPSSASGVSVSSLALAAAALVLFAFSH